MMESQKTMNGRKRAEGNIQAAFLYFEYLRTQENDNETREIYTQLAEEARRELLNLGSSNQHAA